MIILFCGIPGSGKTTIAKILHDQLSLLGRVKLLSSDELRGPVYRKFVKTIASSEQRPDFLILDATFYKREWRQQIKANAEGEKVMTVYLECPRALALQRNRERRPNVSERALHIISYKMERPQNPAITIDTAATSAAEGAAKIFELIKDHCPQR
jgi:predicted kinase